MSTRLATTLLGLLTLASAAGCHLPAATSPTLEPMKKLETLKAVTLDNQGIGITVISTGCTEADDFSVELNRNDDGTTSVAIYRLHPDHCRRAPMPVTLTLPWRDAKPDLTAPIQVINPVTDAQVR